MILSNDILTLFQFSKNADFSTVKLFFSAFRKWFKLIGLIRSSNGEKKFSKKHNPKKFRHLKKSLVL